MKIKRFLLLAISIMMVIATLLSGCSKKGDLENTSGEVVVEEKSHLSMQTSVSYSAGSDSDWSYGNQRKAFPNNEACYVRISSMAISIKSKGVGDELLVTYRFTGAKNCKIEVSDGIVSTIATGDDNVMEFTRTLTAAKEKNAAEDIVIFKYTPKNAESVALEVTYDDQIAQKFDALNTVYFEKVGEGDRH